MGTSIRSVSTCWPSIWWKMARTSITTSKVKRPVVRCAQLISSTLSNLRHYTRVSLSSVYICNMALRSKSPRVEPTNLINLDLSYIIARLGRLDNTKELVSPETVAKNKNVNLYRYYFNTLNEELLNKLVSYYKIDSSLFNYSFDQAKRAIGGWD